MENFKTYILNASALAISVSKINPYLQMISLLLAIIFTIIQIKKQLK